MKQKAVLRVSSKLLMPPIMLFALYVQFHGDYGPGGGFQAGVIFAAALILYCMLFGAIMSGMGKEPSAMKVVVVDEDRTAKSPAGLLRLSRHCRDSRRSRDAVSTTSAEISAAPQRPRVQRRSLQRFG